MKNHQWHPGTLLQLSGSYWQAFALHAGVKRLLGTEGGQSYSEQQIMQWMIDAGLIKVSRLPYQGPTDSGIISATGP